MEITSILISLNNYSASAPVPVPGQTAIFYSGVGALGNALAVGDAHAASRGIDFAAAPDRVRRETQ
jgi:hypothetical protein